MFWLRGCIGMRMVVVCVLMLLIGCGGSKKESIVKPKPPLKIKTIKLTMESNANDNWPVPVELVRVADADLTKELLKIEPKEWFKKAGADFRNAHPGVYFDSWEVVPGTIVGPAKAKVRGRVAGVLFCGDADDSVALRVRTNGKVLVSIREDGCSIGRDSRKKKQGKKRPRVRKRLPKVAEAADS